MADKKLLCVARDWCANIKYQNAELNNQLMNIKTVSVPIL